MNAKTPTRFRLAALVAAGLLVASCSGGDTGDGAGDTTLAPSSTAAAASTVTSTTKPLATTSSAVTDDTVPSAPVMPLTGLPIDDEQIAVRPAMVAKIDNHPQARPQYGLNSADIVFEENVESLTRFAAVFHGQTVDRVGPIRSGRTQDVDLLGSFDKPMFVWSGGNPNVTRTISESDLVSLSPTTTRNVGFFRSRRGNEDSEHTLYANTGGLWLSFTRIYAPAPPQQFRYRTPDEAFNGEAAEGVEVKMDGVNVTWTWDAPTASYLREQGGRPHDDATLGQVNAANVVVLEVDYQPSPADARSPEAQTVGTGMAYVFTGGVLTRGTWTRDDRLDTFELVDVDGAAVGLTPGRTWVELARVGTTTPLL